MAVKIFLTLTLLIAAPLTGLAHHSTAMFNMENPITLTGVVKSFVWKNPHVFLYFDVNGPDGKAEEWLIEMHSTAIMLRRGYTNETFKPGDNITVIGGGMKDGSKMMRLLRGSFQDGKKFYGDDFSPGTAGTENSGK